MMSNNNKLDVLICTCIFIVAVSTILTECETRDSIKKYYKSAAIVAPGPIATTVKATSTTTAGNSTTTRRTTAKPTTAKQTTAKPTTTKPSATKQTTETSSTTKRTKTKEPTTTTKQPRRTTTTSKKSTATVKTTRSLLINPRGFNYYDYGDGVANKNDEYYDYLEYVENENVENEIGAEYEPGEGAEYGKEYEEGGGREYEEAYGGEYETGGEAEYEAGGGEEYEAAYEAEYGAREEADYEAEYEMEGGTDEGDQYAYNDYGETENNAERRKRQATVTACGCYAPAQCNNTGNTDGTGLIDFRIISGGTPNCPTGLTYCCPGSNASSQISCGSRITSYINYPLQSGQAKYGDYPWMALIQNTNNDYIAGGVLIDYQYVLTVAHRISSYSGGSGLKVRLGEWDTSSNYEQYPYREYNISRVWIHESYNPSNLKNDIALLRLTTTVAVYPSVGVVPICMPTSSQSFEEMRCWVSGWGKDQFGAAGRFQSVLRATDVPIITTTACQNSLRSTRLGSAFLLDKSSFICAGGEYNKDACTGDGGSGLVCEVSSGRWVLAGLVAWGIGCATQNVPAAYVNVASYISWIREKQQSYQ